MKKKLKLTKKSLSVVPYRVVITNILSFIQYSGEFSSTSDRAKFSMKSKFVYGYFKNDYSRKVFFLWKSCLICGAKLTTKILNTLSKYVDNMALVYCCADNEVKISGFKYLMIDDLRMNRHRERPFPIYVINNIKTLEIGEINRMAMTILGNIKNLIFHDCFNFPESVPKDLEVLYLHFHYSIVIPSFDDIKFQAVPKNLIVESRNDIVFSRITKKTEWIKRHVKWCSGVKRHVEWPGKIKKVEKCKNIILKYHYSRLDYEQCNVCGSYYCNHCSLRENLTKCDSCTSEVCFSEKCFSTCWVCDENYRIICIRHCNNCVSKCSNCSKKTCKKHLHHCLFCDDVLRICEFCGKKCEKCEARCCEEHIEKCCK
jgi:hypothetical protein